MSAGFPGLFPHWRALIEAVGRSERQVVVVEVFEMVFAGTPFGDGLVLVAAMVMVEQAGRSIGSLWRRRGGGGSRTVAQWSRRGGLRAVAGGRWGRRSW